MHQTAPDRESIPLQDLLYDSNMNNLINTLETPQSDISRTTSGTPETGDETDAFLDLEIRRLQQKLKFHRFFHALWYGPFVTEDLPPSRFETGPLKFLEDVPDKFERISLRNRIILLVLYCCFWYALLDSILWPYFTRAPVVDSDTPIVPLGCTDQLWRGKNGACGLNGEECLLPLKDDVIIRCPALCDRSWTYSLIPMGDQRVKYRGYFVGGGEKRLESELSHPYRADSFLCGSAVHAGVILPFLGGCARVLYLSGSQESFKSAKGHYGVDDSLSFNSYFPASFFFKLLTEHVTHCYDPRLPVLLLNILFGIPVIYLGSGPVIFWILNVVGFWTIVLATDPPVKVDFRDTETTASLLSVGLERFLPSCFILYVIWNISTSYTFDPVNNIKVSHLKRVMCFYPLFWLGVLNNISFDRLPVDRFTLNDLKEQPGGAIAVSCIVLLVAICAVIQAYKVWKAGFFIKYLGIYLLMILTLVLVAQIPGLTLRIHHYILALLLIPGCATKGSTALLFQGILLGLFLSGAARWGLAAIAETDTSLRRNDPSGKVLPPVITGYDAQTGTLQWNDTYNEVFTGISILVNDIERYVAENVTSANLKEFVDIQLDKAKTIPLYVRIGKKIIGTKRYSDFSNAAVIQWPSGEIELPKPGIT